MRLSMEEFKKPCSCGKEHPVYVDTIVIEENALSRIPDYIKQMGCKNIAMFCDDNTYEAAGKALHALLPEAAVYMLSSLHLHANDACVAAAETRMTGSEELLLAVGSGTIHDITRYIAYQRKIPFLSVPTAASVDGFVSTVAAMTWHGFKKSLIACAPAAVFADTGIIARAPYRLTASGISDLYGKYTALTDWRIAHLLTGEHFCERIYQMEMEAIETVTAHLDGLRNGDFSAYEQLMYALLLSGLAMQMMGNSRPASGAEHHMSHLWEMALINEPIDAYHGEKVSVGLSICTQLYHRWCGAIRAGHVSCSDYSGVEEELLSFYMPQAFVDDMAKENTPDVLMTIPEDVLMSALPEVAAIIEETLPKPEVIDGLLAKAGCCGTLASIHLPAEIVPTTIELAPYIRGRLTFLKLLKRLQIEDKTV